MTPTAPPIKGLPEGVELVDLRPAVAEDYELVQDATGPKIYQGPRLGAASGVIVKPAKGWTFHYDIRTLSYIPVKILDTPLTIKKTVEFVVSNTFDQDSVLQAIEKLKGLPGFVSAE